MNDGVCDYDLCCDGSEEYSHAGGVKCQNRCDSIGKEYRKLEEARKQAKEKAAKRRRTMSKEARELRRRVEAKITSLEEEIKGLQAKKDELEQKYQEVERSERGKVVKTDGEGGKLGVLLGLAKSRVSELRDTLDKVLDQRDSLQGRVLELEEILKKFKEEYNPNFNDEGVKAAVKGWEDYAAKTADAKESSLQESEIDEILKVDGETSGINWKEFEGEEAVDTDIRRSCRSSVASLHSLTTSSLQHRGLPARASAGLPPREAQHPEGLADREWHHRGQPFCWSRVKAGDCCS